MRMVGELLVPTHNQSIPACFMQKMEIDEAVKLIVSQPAVDIMEWRKARELQQRIRRQCEINVERRPAGRAA